MSVGADAGGAEHHDQADVEQQRGRRRAPGSRTPAACRARRAATRHGAGHGARRRARLAAPEPAARAPADSPGRPGFAVVIRRAPLSVRSRCLVGVGATAVARRPRTRHRGRRSWRTCPWTRTPAPATPCRRAGRARQPRRRRAPSDPQSRPAPTSMTGTSGACRESASAITSRSRPSSTTPRSRPPTAATRSSNLAPLARPPAIHTTCS